MCDPITAIAVTSTAVSIGGQVVSYSAQNKARKEAQRANKKLQADTTQAANAEYTQQFKAIDTRIKQDQAQATELLKANEVTAKRSVLASTRAAAIADAQARTSAGAAGVTGASVDALLTDITRQDLNNQQTIGSDLTVAQNNIRENLKMATEQNRQQQNALEIQKQNRINGVANLPLPAAPNPWATALQIGQSALQFGQFLQTRKPSK